MKRNIDLITAMRTFLLVVELQSFSAASRKLNIVVSAVSRQVADLEKHFASHLLYRTTRAMHLTSEGEYYLEQIRELIERLDHLESFASERQQTIAGHLKITAPQNSSLIGLQKSIGDFLSLHTDVKISWSLLNRYVNLIEEGIDLALRVGELSDSNLVARPFGELNVLFVASPGYLEKYGMPTHPDDLSKHNCILDSSSRQPGRWVYRESAKEKHVRVTANIDINHGEMVAQFAAAGHGVAQLPDFLVRHFIESGELISILEHFVIPPIPMFLVYPANRMKSPVLKALIEYLLETKKSGFS